MKTLVSRSVAQATGNCSKNHHKTKIPTRKKELKLLKITLSNRKWQIKCWKANNMSIQPPRDPALDLLSTPTPLTYSTIILLPYIPTEVVSLSSKLSYTSLVYQLFILAISSVTKLLIIQICVSIFLYVEQHINIKSENF